MFDLLDGFSWSCDWPQLWGKWNWQTFRFWHFSVEVDSILGQFVIDTALFGFGLRYTWVFDGDTPLRRELGDMSWLENASVTMKYAEYEEMEAAASWAKANGWRK